MDWSLNINQTSIYSPDEPTKKESMRLLNFDDDKQHSASKTVMGLKRQATTLDSESGSPKPKPSIFSAL